MLKELWDSNSESLNWNPIVLEICVHKIDLKNVGNKKFFFFILFCPNIPSIPFNQLFTEPRYVPFNMNYLLDYICSIIILWRLVLKRNQFIWSPCNTSETPYSTANLRFKHGYKFRRFKYRIGLQCHKIISETGLQSHNCILKLVYSAKKVHLELAYSVHNFIWNWLRVPHNYIWKWLKVPHIYISCWLTVPQNYTWNWLTAPHNSVRNRKTVLHNYMWNPFTMRRTSFW